MNVTLTIPDEFAARLGDDADLPRRALEALALEEYRAGRLTQPELRRLLGFETRHELDGFLKAHRVYEDFTVEEIEEQARAIERLGF
jgi:hypothetical protein